MASLPDELVYSAEAVIKQAGLSSPNLPRKYWKFVKTGEVVVIVDNKSKTLAIGELLYKNVLFEMGQAVALRDWIVVAERRVDKTQMKVKNPTSGKLEGTRPDGKWRLCAFREDPRNSSLFTHYNFGDIAGTTTSSSPSNITEQFFVALLGLWRWFYPEMLVAAMTTGRSAAIDYSIKLLPRDQSYPIMRDAQMFFLAPVEIAAFDAVLTFTAESSITMHLNNKSQTVLVGNVSCPTIPSRTLGPAVKVDDFLFVLNQEIPAEQANVFYISCIRDNKLYHYQRKEFPDKDKRDSLLTTIIFSTFGQLLFPALFIGKDTKPVFTCVKC